jgi:ABC-type lipoprotein export system ATPase subunit
MIEIKNLTKIYRRGKQNIVALNDISFQSGSNEFIIIKGTSGCGKSTLLFTIGGMLKPSDGVVEVLGEDIYTMTERKRTSFRSGNIGFVFQSYHLVPYLNVMENILLADRLPGINISEDEALEIANNLNLNERITHKPYELSVGEKQRVALTRALVTNPKIILADEPTGNLDPQNAKEVLEYLSAFHRNGGLVIMVTHGNEADKYATRQIEMKNGRIIEN